MWVCWRPSVRTAAREPDATALRWCGEPHGRVHVARASLRFGTASRSRCWSALASRRASRRRSAARTASPRRSTARAPAHAAGRRSVHDHEEMVKDTTMDGNGGGDSGCRRVGSGARPPRGRSRGGARGGCRASRRQRARRALRQLPAHGVAGRLPAAARRQVALRGRHGRPVLRRGHGRRSGAATRARHRRVCLG
jgi:hypothetical protein